MRHRPTEANRMTATTRLEGQLYVPRQLRIVGDGASAQLYWSIDEGLVEGEPVTDCLTAFMRLAHADDPQAFLAFAKRFGVLGVQLDGRPGNLSAPLALRPTAVEDGVTWRVELLAAWAFYACHARALLLLAEALRQRVEALGPIDAEEVLREAGALNGVSKEQLPTDMYPLAESHSVNSLVENLDRAAEHGLIRQQQWLGHILSRRWLWQSRLTPIVRWSGPAPTLELDISTLYVEGLWGLDVLFSVLAAQLAAAFTNAGRYSQCSACGEFYIPSGRRARLDRAHFCSPACQADGARRRKRESAARRRERERAAS